MANGKMPWTEWEAVYLGDVSVSKIYLGSDLVWPTTWISRITQQYLELAYWPEDPKMPAARITQQYLEFAYLNPTTTTTTAAPTTTTTTTQAPTTTTTTTA